MNKKVLPLLLLSLFSFSALAARPPEKPSKRVAGPAARVRPKVEGANQAPAENDPGRRFEVRTAPLLLLFRIFTIEALYKFHPQWAVGPSVIGFAGAPEGNMFIPSIRGRAWGVVATYYFQPADRGWYGTARLYFEKYTSYFHNSAQSSVGLSGQSLTLLAGYRLPLARQFFAMIGGGLQFGRYDRLEGNWGAGTNAFSANPNFFRVLPYIEGKVGVEF